MAQVVLAYSGSLDTTICIHWLREIRGMKVVTFSANLGQIDALEPLAERAVDLGVTAAHIADLRDAFVREFVFPCVRANAEYERGYFLFSALSRPLIVRELVKIAREEGCEFIAHGGRGGGNDIARFENCIRAIAPEMGIITPLEELGLNTPKEYLRYAKERGLKVERLKQTIHNVEQNIWGSNIQIPMIRNTWSAIPDDLYVMTTSPIEAPSRVTEMEIKFVSGIPVAIDGEALSAVTMVDRLNQIGGRNGIGRYDVIENRLNDRKTRELYEAPAAAILMEAHRALESAALGKDLLHHMESFSRIYAELIYEGKWFTPFREALDAFFTVTQKDVTGKVRLRIFKGQVTVSGVKPR